MIYFDGSAKRLGLDEEKCKKNLKPDIKYPKSEIDKKLLP